MVGGGPVAGWKISGAAARCGGHGVGGVGGGARGGGLRGSSSLRVDAIRAVDIFIGGCYLWCPGFLGRGKENKAILILFL